LATEDFSAPPLYDPETGFTKARHAMGFVNFADCRFCRRVLVA
jgi:hypothetical protein